MSLSEFLRNYRAEHELSMDDLAKRCGLSKPYISMLEKNRNSKNGKSITPSIRTYEKIAHGVGLTVDSLMKLINGNERVALMSSDISSLKNIVPIERCMVPIIGQIAAVRIDDDATLKRFYKNPDGCTLVSMNPQYPPMIFNSDNCDSIQIIGLAVAKYSVIKQ